MVEDELDFDEYEKFLIEEYKKTAVLESIGDHEKLSDADLAETYAELSRISMKLFGHWLNHAKEKKDYSSATVAYLIKTIHNFSVKKYLIEMIKSGTARKKGDGFEVKIENISELLNIRRN